MNEKKEKTRGIIGTILFHLVVLIGLIFLGLSTPLPLPGEEGVEVNLGYDDYGQDFNPSDQPASITPPEPKQEEIVEEEVVKEMVPDNTQQDQIIEEIEEEEILTDDTEETPAITNPEEKDELEEVPDEQQDEPEENKPEDKPEITEDKTVTEEQTETQQEQVVEEQVEEPKVNPKALYPGKQASEGTDQPEGQTGEPGNQGKPHGDVESENYEGHGGIGEGVSYDLGGRGAKHLPKPTYSSEDQGKVVVTIWVDKRGVVVRAEAGAKGTTVSDPELRRVAKEAAERAKFNPDPNAPEIQKGTITYNFIIMQ